MRVIRSVALLCRKSFSLKAVHCDDLEAIICRQIRSIGPISLAEYMKLALYHPIYGYYKNSSVIGPSGDFITSPEICQIFGELLGIWVVNEWMKTGKQTHFDIVEFGPGRGTLMTTILRTMCRFPTGSSLFSHLRLIERSDRLREAQEAAILPLLKKLDMKPEVTWHASLEEIPTGTPTFYLAHEFFDALPIHRFQLVDGKWSEVFVNAINTEQPKEPGDQLVFQLSPSQTLAEVTYLPLAGDLKDRLCVEVCPDAGAILQNITSRIANDGGSALVIDYGHCGEGGDTLRAFRNHKLHDPLKDPGHADITSDVDFAFLRRSIEATNNPVIIHGPVSQAYFLVHMGILMRLKALVDRTESEDDKKNLIAGVEMLITSQQMGKRFKFMAICAGRSQEEKKHVPAGFYPTWREEGRQVEEDP